LASASSDIRIAAWPTARPNAPSYRLFTGRIAAALVTEFKEHTMSEHRPMTVNTRQILIAAMAAAALVAGTGCAVVRDQQSVGSYVDDATLTARVKAKFAEDKTVSAMSISVETLKGVVQLSGFAKSSEEKLMAERLARGTSGVAGVRNDIIVRS